MNSFSSIEKLDTIILYILELASSLSVLLLAFCLIASVANVLNNGTVLTRHSWAQEAYAWTQAVAIDASVAGVIIRTFQYRKEGQRIKMWLYAMLSCLLLFTAAIVSNIESIQQTLNIPLTKAYLHVFVSVEVLIWARSLTVRIGMRKKRRAAIKRGHKYRGKQEDFDDFLQKRRTERCN